MVENPGPHPYRPLNFEQRGFRVTILQPAADFSSPIYCDLVEVTLDDHPDYEAISYVWGDPSHPASLQVGGTVLKATVSLDLALRYLRLPDRPRTLWVDAICIDQSNIVERNQQVRLMKDIYSSCIRDLVWLGEGSPASEKGIACLAQMKSLDIQRVTDRGRKIFNKASLHDLGILDGDDWAIEQIIETPRLWERAWVMQEIACCPEALLIVGNLTMSWTILSSILDHSGVPDRYHLPFSHQRYEQSVWDAFAKTQVIEHQRDILKGISPLHSTLLDVLSRFRATISTDPRDKIYGLLGLATDGLDIVPDYNKSVRDVYIDVARSHINATKDLDMVTQSLWPLGNMSPKELYGYTSHELPSAYAKIDLPSWVPNFSATQTKKILFAQRAIFAAGSPTCSCPVVISPEGLLKITGTVLSRIKILKPVRKMVYSGGEYFSPWARDWLPETISGKSSSAPRYPVGGDLFEAFWRTLMTDSLAFHSRRLSERDIEEYSKLFEDWREHVAGLPYNESPDKYDGDQDFLYSMGAVAEKTGIKETMWKWRFAELEGGLFAMVPWDGPRDEGKVTAKVDDIVAVVDGGKVPIVLREKPLPDGEARIEGDVKYEIIGTAYVHGFMDRLAAAWVETGKLEQRIFDIT